MFNLVEGTFDALIFDCDGTLIDTATAHLSALRVGLAEHGLTMTDEFYYPRSGLTPRALFDDYEREIVGAPVQRAEVLARYAVSFKERLDLLKEISVVAEVARAWNGHVPMAVGSNGQRGNVESTLRAKHLLGLFDTVVVAADVAAGKPAPDIFLEAARRLGARPERCVVFEDTDEGLTAARAAGMESRDIRKVWRPAWRQ